VRIGDTPSTITAEYYNVTCNPLCTKFYKVEDGKATNRGVFPNMPSDIPDPHTLSIFEGGDRITLTGFTYEWTETNLITNNTKKRVIDMIDVISWQYSDSIKYDSTTSDQNPKSFKHENYTDCRP